MDNILKQNILKCMLQFYFAVIVGRNVQNIRPRQNGTEDILYLSHVFSILKLLGLIKIDLGLKRGSISFYI